jgi:hypothetical protein
LKGYKPHVIRDQIAFLCNAARLRVPAFSVLTRIQDFTPGEQVLGTAVALVAMCESANLSLNDVITTARTVMADADGPFTSHIRAVRDYAANEIARGEEARGL